MVDADGLNNRRECEIHSQKLNISQDEDMQAYGYRRSGLKTFFVSIAHFLTIGILRLFFHWNPNLHLYSTHKKCSLSEASKILIIDDYQGKYRSYFVKKVQCITIEDFQEMTDKESVQNIKNENLKVNLENGTKMRVSEYKAFFCKKECYVWDATKCEFSKLTGLDKYVYCSDLSKKENCGLSKKEETLQQIVYGKNEILVPVQSIGVLLVLEVLNPFYIFQIFTLAVWLPEGYVYYSFAIVCMSVFGIASSILQTRKNQISLRNTVATIEMVQVLRDTGEFESISSVELVPGDVIELPKHRGTIVCDAVLLTGNCIVNESMLTGESVPVMKTPLQSRPVLYDSKECSHNTLFCGTTVIQTKNYGNQPVLAKVIRTGLQTNKGKLVAAILYPPPTDFKFDQDSYKFIGILSFIALCGFVYTVITKVSRGMSVFSITINALDIITIVIPPALPAVMTIGKLYAQSRLQKQQIYCINTRAINISGSINCICFDKTGTLTEDGLDMMGVVPNVYNNLGEPEKCPSKLQKHQIFEGMLVCHSLTLIDGEVSGDPLDIKMFESTGWNLEEPEIDESDGCDLRTMTLIKPPKGSASEIENEIHIVQQYQFSSTLQRMSVIVRLPKSGEFLAYTKGSPEMILSLSKPKSIPNNVTITLRKYTEQGYRVIAVGYTRVDADRFHIPTLPRETIEKDMEFLGLIILENRLKNPTVKVIRELREANIRTIMITGDNIQTAVSVAKECGILLQEDIVVNVNVAPLNAKNQPHLFFNVQEIPSSQGMKYSATSMESIESGLKSDRYKFAVTGNTWQLLREHHFDILPKICVKGAVFARMNSDQKQQLVVELMQLGYYVVMCGDGANDCGALRAAHVGISLSEAESSVASPFTSRIPDVRCVPIVLQQGRAALVTSFGIFKFMVNYSLTEFASTVILYSIDSNLTDLEYLFIDICLAVNFAFYFGKTEAYAGKLAKKPPMSSLISFETLFSLAVHMILIAAFQASAFHIVQLQPWFTPFIVTNETNYSCYENYSVFCTSIFQYITLAVIFSRGKPYRKPLYTNYGFIMSLVIMTIVCIYITLYPAEWVVKALQLMMPPALNWRLAILCIALVNFLMCFFIEYFLIEWAIEHKIKPKLHKPEKSKKLYLRLEHELQRDHKWPPISKEHPALPISPSSLNIIHSNTMVNTSDSEITVTHYKEKELKTIKKVSDSIQRIGGLDNEAFVEDE